MQPRPIKIPEIQLIAGTRMLGGLGLGLLLADWLPPSQRRPVGWGLFLVGALSTIPLVMHVLS